jgi:lysophospholipase L1-like esterase
VKPTLRKRSDWLLVVVVVCVCLAVGEGFLRLFYPAQLQTIGSDFPENAGRYGWGYGPHQRIVVSDPDTGRVFVDFANNRGWRDRNHELEKPPGVFRLLVLGDSNSFGAIVPASSLFTRLLEEKFLAVGKNVEVINLSYGGWSTAQELEAFRLEGRFYRPDLVVVQFTSNDLGENLFMPSPARRARTEVPFYYAFDDQGRLIRHINPYFSAPEISSWKSILKRLTANSELGKRAYLVWLSLVSGNQRQIGGAYQVGQLQLRQLELAFGISPNDPLGGYLAANLDKPLEKNELSARILASPHKEQLDDILRVAQQYWFTSYWTPENFNPAPPDSKDPRWQAYFELMRQMKAETAAIGAKLAILSTEEDGVYQWDLFWHRVASTKQAHDNYLAPNALLSHFAEQEGIRLVPLQASVQRAKLDPHPNAAGNEAIADSLFSFVLSNYADQLTSRDNHLTN